MASDLTILLLSKTPAKVIDGRQFSVWCYQLSWSGAAVPASLSGNVALVLSANLDIKTPAAFPDVAEIQNTQISNPAGTDRQYVYTSAPAVGALDMQFAFLAPDAEDSFTPVLLAAAAAAVGPWHSLAFSASTGGAPASVQMLRGPSAVSAPTTQGEPGTAGKLSGANRRIAKCTYVPLKFEGAAREDGGAVMKFGFVGRLQLQAGEVDAAERAMANSRQLSGQDKSLLSTLRQFEGTPIPAQLPSPKFFSAIPASTLHAFGQAVVKVRQENLNQVKTESLDLSTKSSLYTPALNRYNGALVAVNAFENNVAVSPIGMLNLERIEMTPVGVQRGELIATIPLAPLEQTAVVHKEWSVTSQEYTSIVTDSLENYSETGVTENTDLAQSTTSQTTHGSQFNINATVSGGYGPVTATVSTGFATQDQTSRSATESRNHAISTTRKASTRVKQEHKVTITTTTVTGTSETSTRILQNPSNKDAMRIDYFSIMRKWHVGLYRYGLRLTYDIAIPEPGATLRRIYAQLDRLQNMIGPFYFPLSFLDITRDTWGTYAAQYEVMIPGPPPDTDEQSFSSSYTNGGDTTFYGPVYTLELDIKDGYSVSSATLYANQVPGGSGDTLIADINVARVASGDSSYVNGDTVVALNYLNGLTGRQFVVYETTGSNSGNIEVDVQLKITDGAFIAWQQQAWNALFNAAQTQYYTRQQNIQSQISALQEKLNNVDTLTLRREESEEIMKGVLRWLLGPTFDFMPADVVALFEQPPDDAGNYPVDLMHGAATDTGDGLAVTSQSWFPMLMYQEMVKFVNEAIEWENVLYFLYSYFWDVPPSWNFIRQIRHPDSTRQAFLRSGSARVVLTVRKGWEEAWVNFVEAGGFGATLMPSHPYLSIAKEIENYDQTNYPGIPPANPGGGPLPDDGESVSTVSSDTLTAGAGPVNIMVQSSVGFIVGYTAVIDSYDTKDGSGKTLQETQTITAVPDALHITVERVDNPHSGSPKPFVVMQAGEKGQLIAEWFEYTPTSGTDIAVTSNLATIG